jgi:uncharacterized protein (TIGR02466 family)
MTTQSTNLFSCTILSSDTNIDNKKLIKYCEQIKKKDKGRVVSNEGGYQSNLLDLSNKELQPLITNIIQSTSVYLNQCSFKNELKYELQSMWLNINSYKDSNRPHIHPQCLFSGVYYVKAPENCGNIVFLHPVMELLSYDWNDEFKSKLIENNSPNWKMPYKDGRLYLFPSWLRHSVMPNLNKKEKRISIAFNVGLK